MWRPSCALLLLLGAWSRAGEAEPRPDAPSPATAPAPAPAAGLLRRPVPASALDAAWLLCRENAHRDWRPCALPWSSTLLDDQQLELLDGAGLPTEEKRALKFNPWGGKREQVNPAKPRPRKAYFSPWGGKRALPFNSWGGKRSDGTGIAVQEDDSLLDEDEKRTGFHSWGGKRMASPADSSFDDALALALLNAADPIDPVSDLTDVDKRTTFHSWGGKREIPSSEANPAPADAPRLAKRKTKFYPWGGKRDGGGGDRGPDVAAVLRRGGADFYPWGGKRSTLPVA